jgi:hypothetical protein
MNPGFYLNSLRIVGRLPPSSRLIDPVKLARPAKVAPKAQEVPIWEAWVVQAGEPAFATNIAALDTSRVSH